MAVSTASEPPEQKKTRLRSPGVQLGEHLGQLHRGDGGEGHRRGVARRAACSAMASAISRAAVTGVDDPETGDAVEILAALDVVEASAFAAIEDAEVIAFELGPRQHVNPDVVAGGLLRRCDATGCPFSATGVPGWASPCAELFGDLRSDHR